MAYIFEEITIRTDNSILGIERINALWNDVNNGRLAVLFDSEGNLGKNCENCTFPIACYSNYENDDKGMYNVSIKKVDSKFFADMEDLITYGKYVRYKSSGYDIETAIEEAWGMVKEDSKNGGTTG